MAGPGGNGHNPPMGGLVGNGPNHGRSPCPAEVTRRAAELGGNGHKPATAEPGGNGHNQQPVTLPCFGNEVHPYGGAHGCSA
jgi:hypothetical protein